MSYTKQKAQDDVYGLRLPAHCCWGLDRLFGKSLHVEIPDADTHNHHGYRVESAPKLILYQEVPIPATKIQYIESMDILRHVLKVSTMDVWLLRQHLLSPLFWTAVCISSFFIPSALLNPEAEAKPLFITQPPTSLGSFTPTPHPRVEFEVWHRRSSNPVVPVSLKRVVSNTLADESPSS